MREILGDRITINEVTNDGYMVHIYYIPARNCLEAYGISAYLVSHTAPTIPTYSDEEQMPMVTVDDRMMGKLRKRMDVVMETEGQYYRLKARERVTDDQYTEWAKKMWE